MRQLLLVAVAFVALAPAAHAGTTWKSDTQGSPVGTEFGRWTEVDENSVRLDFLGGHLIGEQTTFLAKWRTPWTEARKPRFDAEFEISNFNEVGADISMRIEFRSRDRGRGWTDWFGTRQVLRPGSNNWGGSMGFRGFEKRSVQFEWRMKGKITAPTYLDGYASMSIN